MDNFGGTSAPVLRPGSSSGSVLLRTAGFCGALRKNTYARTYVSEKGLSLFPSRFARNRESAKQIDERCLCGSPHLPLRQSSSLSYTLRTRSTRPLSLHDRPCSCDERVNHGCERMNVIRRSQTTNVRMKEGPISCVNGESREETTSRRSRTTPKEGRGFERRPAGRTNRREVGETTLAPYRPSDPASRGRRHRCRR